ncbi:MAG: glycosyltransferase [Candidatus Dechloromonas phosphoritropha]
MIRVLGLALYGPLAASTRYRLGQYVPGLAEEGIELKIVHLLGDDYLRRRFSGEAWPVGSMLRAGVGRFADLLGQSDFDVAMLHCELYPFLPGGIERALIRIPYVYDFDDAFYLKYRSGAKRLFKPLLGCKFDKVIAGAAVITAGNSTLANYARQFNSKEYYLPTVVDTERYIPSARDRSEAVFTVGWIGSPSTAPYLAELVAPLSLLGLEGQVRFVGIGGKAPVIPNVSVVEINWQESTEIDLINTFDVGVMPLPDDDWAKGKCAFKLIQYMACGVPVVASAVGANVEVVTNECGLLASTRDEWLSAFRLLRDERSKRIEMGRAARERVEQHYSLRHNLPVLANVLRAAAGKR